MTTPGIPLEATTVVWAPMSPAERDAYEQEHHYAPPGYRGTGPVEWFIKRHEETGPCVTCGAITDRWELRNTYIGTGGLPSATYNNHALCGEMVAFCAECQCRESISILEQRQRNLEILPGIREAELIYLTELRCA